MPQVGRAEGSSPPVEAPHDVHPCTVPPAVTSPVFPSSNSTVTPKVQQANGTHVPRSPEANHSPADSDREWERDAAGGGCALELGIVFCT